MRLWPCKTSFSPPVILYYLSIQDVVLLVLCLGVECLCRLHLMCVFKFLGSGSLVAYNMFSKYKYLIDNLVFSTSVFGVGISF